MDFLHSLGVAPLQDPQGFEKISEHTFVYAPGAEAAVLFVRAGGIVAEGGVWSR